MIPEFILLDPVSLHTFIITLRGELIMALALFVLAIMFTLAVVATIDTTRFVKSIKH